MMIGRGVWAAISVTISWVKAPPMVEVPISTVGFTEATTSANVTCSGSATRQPATSARERA